MSAAPAKPSTLGERLRRAATRCHQAASAAAVAGEAIDSTDLQFRSRGSWLADVAQEFAQEVAAELDELATELES